MPPKRKYTKEQIIDTALVIVSKKGMQALTARELGDALNTSVSPIFTMFNSMQEVQNEVKEAAMRCFEGYAHRADRKMPLFKQIGMQMILFAKEEPNLYQVLFMSPNNDVRNFDDIYGKLGSVADESIELIVNDYGLSQNDARALFEHSWIHTFGIGVMCATGMCQFSDDEISKMLTEDFMAMMALLKTKRG